MPTGKAWSRCSAAALKTGKQMIDVTIKVLARSRCALSYHVSKVIRTGEAPVINIGSTPAFAVTRYGARFGAAPAIA